MTSLPQYPDGASTRAWVVCGLPELLTVTDDELLGRLATRCAGAGHPASELQVHAWRGEIEWLRTELTGLLNARAEASAWWVLLESPIPRRGKRIDVVLLTGAAAVVIEVKVGAAAHDRAARWQVEDYALDLRDFHAGSSDLEIVAVVAATGCDARPTRVDGDSLPVWCVGASGLSRVLEQVDGGDGRRIDASAWDSAEYRPTPGIIEATCRLHDMHTVADLAHATAGNLDQTVSCLAELVDRARTGGERLVCLVTGVPGAGKTLVGIAAASLCSASDGHEQRAAYMSGNGPLVRVLREALARDGAARHGTKRAAMRFAETLVQNVHEFIHLYGVDQREMPPDEHVIVFDEAQRAWHAEKLAKRHPGVRESEPALVLDVMARAPSWSVLVALIGSGQEIHDGEAGMPAWGQALASSSTPWRVAVASGRGGQDVLKTLWEHDIPTHITVEDHPEFHLDVSMRSPRAERISAWVDAVLGLAPDAAREALGAVDGYRLALTRDLETARRWMRDLARDELRPGLLASSGAKRLRAHGIEVHPDLLNALPIERWFLDSAEDYRSSHALEIAMTEFKVQGLEIDVAGVCWGNDLTVREDGRSWSWRQLRTARWQQVRSRQQQLYMLNKYRVLLTRAREGMIVWVPRGDARDPTREPTSLDRTAEHLQRCGLDEI